MCSLLDRRVLEHEKKVRFKMYKDGKKWCFAAIATVTFGAGIVYNTNSAHADTNDNATITASASTASATTNASGASSTSSASSILKSVTSTDSQISNVSVSVTTEDGTVMNGGDSYTIASGQSVNLSSINISFTLTQDGTLTSGSVVKIPVSVTNNSDELVSSALSSGTSIDIENVGTIYYEDGYYVLTIGDDFDQTVGKQVSVTVTEKPASTSKITATDSYNNMVLTIGNETFTFIPQHRTYTEDTGDYSSSDFSYSPSANTINTGTTMTDPNYINNIISSNGSDAGETGIPTGNIISIQHISTSGSSVVSIKLGTYFGSSTLQINEDGTYLITGDNSESFSLGDNTGIINIITMSADSTDAEIIAALNAAGKGSGVIIENSDGSYTLAYNFGVITSDDNKTYGEVFGDSADAGISTSSDASQEINRTDDVNAKLNELLSSAYIIQDLGVQNNVVFSDGSVINYLTGTGTEYNVDSSGTATVISSSNFSSSTTPSNSRAEGQSKITVHYVDENGTELQSDQDVYYVYAPNKESATVTYIDDTTGEVLSTANLSGNYGTTDSYRTADTIQNYESEGYSLVSDDYPSDGVVYDEDGTVKSYVVHLTHSTSETTENKSVNETIHYVYSDGSEAYSDYTATPVEFTRTVTTDNVTGEKVYGDWTAVDGSSFSSVTSPTITGYTPDKGQVDGVNNVTADTADIVDTVTYTANKETANVTYIDDTTGEVLSTANLSGDYGTTDSYRTADTIQNYESEGYSLVSDDYPSDGVVYDEDGTVKSYEVTLSTQDGTNWTG
ncbi:KxYKxGKxW signal peptide domain-containing protein (plasmid) [Paucilactobacillus suebicus]|uniref:mucin-binding protein n=1 Tax=Paucilactobacillus suebicus TaxID=152335 RepID=UPI002286D668|nr:KxYKxGKxW signal peptide domain-containing protein [Paucilactobacillus suebicus]